MRVPEFHSPFARVAASMVHPGARRDSVSASLQGAFIATRLLAAAAAVLVAPVYLALRGAPDPLAAVCFAWLMAPLGVAVYLSRTGDLPRAHMMSAAILSGLVVFVAAATGGIASPFLSWLVAIPAEAALSGAAATVGAATGIAAIAFLGLAVLDVTGLLPATVATAMPAWALMFLGVLPALLYAGALSARSAALTRLLGEDRQDSGAHLRDIVAAAGEAIVTLTRTGNVTFATHATDDMFDIPPSEISGEGLFARVHIADRPSYLKALDEAAAGADAVADIRVRRGELDAQPHYFWIEMRCRPLAVGRSGKAEIVAVLREVDDRKQVEQRLGEAREEAERANVAKGKFLANVSHELRTPLNAIIGFSEILAGDADGRLGADRHREYAALIHESGNHLLDVVNDVLDLSRIESGRFELAPGAFDVVELIGSCRRLMEDQACAAGLRIETDLPHSMPDLVADRRAVKQILLNLLSNAIKFSKSGGRIVVGAYRDGPALLIYVADEGIGIPRNDIARLGDPFLQLESSHDRRHAGTGLGLSVVKGLVALHGGRIEIDSEVGVGTRMTVRLPLGAPVAVPHPDTRDEDVRLSA